MEKFIKITTKTFLIAGGNSTLLVWNCPEKQKEMIVKKGLKKVEQVGFVADNNLTMMGNELCINSTIALASQLTNKGSLTTSGILQPVIYFNRQEITGIELPIRYIRQDNNIILPGIGFKCLFKKRPLSKKELAGLCNKYALPAFGIALFENEVLTPYVYVEKVDSFFAETACGSASIAISALTGKNKIIQPTGEAITVKVNKESISVSAKVIKI